MKFLIGVVVGLILLPLFALAYLRLGYAPVATASSPLPFEKALTGMALDARLAKEAPKQSPIAASEPNLMAGAKTYRDYCSGCHGMRDGPQSAAAKGMFPPPPQFFHGDDMSGDPVGDTFWKASNGIRLTGMPAYRGTLTDDQLWQVSQLVANGNKLPAAVQAFMASPMAAKWRMEKEDKMYRCLTIGLACILSGISAWAQLIQAGQPVPKTAKLPVIFLNGYETDCGNASFSHTFGIADQVLQANGQVSLFFNYCSVSGSPGVEDLGVAFATFLSNLHYADGGSVDRVDIVAHSLGGIVVRTYLSGKQAAAGTFNPPAVTHVRKIVFVATPHFGTGIGLPFGNTITSEVASGSRFLFDLATWNQGTDDLRGTDAIAVIGNGGTGHATTDGFDDGVIALTSASLGFYMPGRTRVVPFCHTDGGGFISFAGYCGFNALGIAVFRSTTQDPAKIILSFLNDTADWQSIGVAAEQNSLLAANGGLNVTVRSANDASLRPDSMKAVSASGKSKDLNLPSNDVGYTDMFPAGPLTLTATAGAVHVSQSLTLPAGAVDPIVLKPGPTIARVLPAAASTFPLSVAPGMIVAVYGVSLAAQTAQASGLPLPLQLSDAQVMLGGAPVPLFYASSGQVNALIPDGAFGLVKFGIQNASGSHTVNVLVEAAVPAIFTQDQSGKGPAAAINVKNNQLVTSGNPVHAGEYLQLFLTGLGLTTNQGGLDVANQQPTVSISGKDCPVTYAGRAPGFAGLDQINCVIPSGLSGDAPITVTSGSRMSNVATIAVQ